MAIFVVFRIGDRLKMEAAVKRAFPDDHISVDAHSWLVAAKGTAKEVSNKLGITPGNDSGNGIVVSVADYYGRASTAIWDWIRAKAEQHDG